MSAINDLNDSIGAYQAGRIDFALLQKRVDAERAERERTTFSVYNGFGSAAAWADFLANYEALPDAELDAALKAEIAGGHRTFELTAIGKQFYERGNLAMLERVTLYCQRLTSVCQFANWREQNKHVLIGQ